MHSKISVERDKLSAYFARVLHTQMGGEMDRLFETYESSKLKFEIIEDIIRWYNDI
jgi:hypothetical protein